MAKRAVKAKTSKLFFSLMAAALVVSLVSAPAFADTLNASEAEVVSTLGGLAEDTRGNVFASSSKIKDSADQIEIIDDGVPLGSFDTSGAWSLLSFIMAFMALLISLVAIVWNIIRRVSKKDTDSAHGLSQEKSFLLGALTIMFGVLPLLVFLMVDDMALNIVWINSNTKVVAIFFGVFALSGLAYLLVKKGDKKDKDKGQGTASSHTGASLT